ncbi:MAG: DegQ family serine endoprotease [Candidatus Sericytochromatia bacterium]|nr:DegQ family serine endoprotease [Candidatus Sericytochromatia bacterium]
MTNNTNKSISKITLFSTGFSGVIAGSLLSGGLSFVSAATNSNNANNPKVPAIVERAETGTSKSTIADKLSTDFINVAKNVTPSIVTINSTKNIKQVSMQQRFFDSQGDEYNQGYPQQMQKQQSLGSGVIVDKLGIILTNNHVVEGADEISVTLQDKRKFKAKVLGTDPKTDLAVIKIEKADNLPVAKLGDSNKVSVGEWVLAIGNPLGLSSSVTSGIISAKGRDHVGIVDFENFLQTDAAINPGNSGGALVNLQGEVIGINTAIASKTGGYMGIGFAIPSTMAQKIMSELISKGKITRGFLGIQIQDINDSFARSLKLPNDTKGIIVGKIEHGSPAEKAGLKPYDIISELNDTAVEDVSAFRNAIASEEPGKKVNLAIIRDGKKMNISVGLGELEKKIAKAQIKPKLNSTDKLGFQVEPLTPEMLSQLNINQDVAGVIVSNVKNDSTASEAGLERGDIIQEANRNSINSEEDFNHATNNLNSGDSVLLKVIRQNSPILLALTIK